MLLFKMHVFIEYDYVSDEDFDTTLPRLRMQRTNTHGVVHGVHEFGYEEYPKNPRVRNIKYNLGQLKKEISQTNTQNDPSYELVIDLIFFFYKLICNHMSASRSEDTPSPNELQKLNTRLFISSIYKTPFSH